MADTSHELRTPLTILEGEPQAVEDGVRPWNENTRVPLQAEVGRLSTLVEDLHSLSMSDSGIMGYENPIVSDRHMPALDERCNSLCGCGR